MKDPDRPTLVRTKNYDARRVEYSVLLPLLRNAILNGIQRHATRPQGLALDVGCGEQPFRESLEGRGYRYASFDVAQNQAATVDELGVIDGELPASLIARGPFDFLLCTEVLEHVADWRRAFENLHRLLAPGGRLLITCPHIWHLHEVPYDFWRPTAYALRYFAAACQMTVVESQNLGDGSDVLATVAALMSAEARGPAPWRWFIHGTYAVGKRMLVAMVRSPFMRRVVRLRSGLYLSNFIVLERPLSG